MLLWTLLDADALKRASEASPEGARRTASLALLRPLSVASRILLVGQLGDAIQRALGRNPQGAPGSGATTQHLGAQPKTQPSTPSVAPGADGNHPSPSAGASPKPPKARHGHGALPPLRVPTHRDPLRVLVVGDSFATDIGYGLGRAFNLNVVSLNLQGVISSGLARPDFYDWPQKLAQDVTKLNPEIVVIMIGGNDFHSVLLPNGHSIAFSSGKTWRRAYRAKVVSFVREANYRGARVAWVGLPIMGSEGYSNTVKRLNSVYRGVARRFKDVVYVDSWHLFANKQGRYAAYLPDANGDLQPVRTADNIHLSPQGNDRLAGYAIRTFRKTWKLPRKAVAR